MVRNMSEETNLSATVEVPVKNTGEHQVNPANELLKPDAQLMILTWITFGLLVAILYKIAWKPIMLALDNREKSIKKALDEAEAARKELLDVQDKSRKMFEEAEHKSREVIDSAKSYASRMSDGMIKKAETEAAAIVAAAKIDINTAVEEARKSLRAETGRIALEVAGKIIGENMNTEKNKALSEKLVKGIK